MTALNRAAAEALSSLPSGAVQGCTDVTGFGLLGHASEMASASAVTIHLQASSVPLLPGALDLALRNRPAGGANNEQYFGPGIAVHASVDAALLSALYDPQTSGGLLAAIAPAHVDRAFAELGARGIPAQRVGHASARDTSALIVT
jgi:selenide,water dikinase